MATHEDEIRPHEPLDEARATSKPFRFKPQPGSRESDDHADARQQQRDRKGNHRHHHRRHKRRRLSKHPDHSTNSSETSSLPPDVAFRESLFDALGDEEGAEYWQGVYGQPIHSYSRNYTDADTGEVDTMNDEQYAQYVRRKMWEKSAEGIEAARYAKREQQKQQEESRRKERSNEIHQDEPAYNNFTFDFELEASLRRGEKRRERKKWQNVWDKYTTRWKDLQQLSESRQGSSTDNVEQVFLRNKIAWPVESDARKDITLERVEEFVNNVSAAVPNATKAGLLKSERIRWHPDKIQQRYGFMAIEENTMVGVTAIFQILDRLWNETREITS